MDEEVTDGSIMGEVPFGKREGLSHQSGDALAQSKVEPLGMIGVAFFFTIGIVLVLRYDLCIAGVEVGEAQPRVVLLLHGVNRQGELRGSGVMLGDPAGLLLFEGRCGSEVVRLKATKLRDFGLSESEMTLRQKFLTLEEMPDQYGRPSTGVVFTRDDTDLIREHKAPGAKGDKGRISTQSSDLNALSEKETATWQALLPLYTTNAHGVTSSTWEAAARKLGVSSASFARAKKKLIGLDWVW